MAGAADPLLLPSLATSLRLRGKNGSGKGQQRSLSCLRTSNNKDGPLWTRGTEPDLVVLQVTFPPRKFSRFSSKRYSAGPTQRLPPPLLSPPPPVLMLPADQYNNPQPLVSIQTNSLSHTPFTF